MEMTTSQPFQNVKSLNTTQHYDNLNERQIESSDIPIYVCYAVISIIGFICNSITIMVMIRNPSLQTLYNFLLLNLAIGDLISSVFSIAKFIIIICMSQASGFSDHSAMVLCRIITPVIYVSIVMSVLTLTAISLERYFGIVKPLIHRNMTPKRLKVFLIFCWGTTIIVPGFISGELRMEKKRYYCFVSSDENDWPLWKKAICWFGLIFAYIIPFIVITVAYFKIITHMRLQSQEPNIATGENSQSAQLVQQKNNKTIRLLIFITVSFSVAILPEIVYFAMIFSDTKYIDAVLFYQVGVPTVAINAVNPLIYTLSNPRFRNAARLLIRPPQQRRVAPFPQTTKTTAPTH